MQNNKEIMMLKLFKSVYIQNNDIEISYNLLSEAFSRVEIEYYLPKAYCSLLELLLENHVNELNLCNLQSTTLKIKESLFQLSQKAEKDREFIIAILRKIQHYEKLALCYYLADLIWYNIKDKSIDFNFYTKRAILAKVIFRLAIKWNMRNIENSDIDNLLQDVQKLGKIKTKALHLAEKIANIPLLRFIKIKLTQRFK